MPSQIEHLQAYLGINNCFLVMLTDCFCDRFAARCDTNWIVSEAEQWSDHIFSIVKRFGLDGHLHCSAVVAN